MKEIIYYQTIDNKIPYLEWYNSLDKGLKIVIDKQLNATNMEIINDYRKIYMN